MDIPTTASGATHLILFEHHMQQVQHEVVVDLGVSVFGCFYFLTLRGMK